MFFSPLFGGLSAKGFAVITFAYRGILLAARAEVLDSWFDRNGRTMSVFDFFSRTMSDFEFWVERCPFLTLFDFTGHCLALLDFVRLCSVVLEIVRPCPILSGISRRVLSYSETRTSFDCFCQIIFQKPQPGQPQNIIENATKLSNLDLCSPDWVVGLMFLSNRTKMFWPVRLKMAMFWPT